MADVVTDANEYSIWAIWQMLHDFYIESKINFFFGGNWALFGESDDWIADKFWETHLMNTTLLKRTISGRLEEHRKQPEARVQIHNSLSWIEKDLQQLFNAVSEVVASVKRRENSTMMAHNFFLVTEIGKQDLWNTFAKIKKIIHRALNEPNMESGMESDMLKVISLRIFGISTIAATQLAIFLNSKVDTLSHLLDTTKGIDVEREYWPKLIRALAVIKANGSVKMKRSELFSIYWWERPLIPKTLQRITLEAVAKTNIYKKMRE